SKDGRSAAMTRASSRRLIVAAAAIGVLLRLAFALTYRGGKPLTHDEREYLALAQSLREGRGFHYPPDHESGTAQQFGRAPGYPVFLAAIGAPSGVTAAPTRVKIVQALLGAIVVWMIGLLAGRAAGARAGVIAAAIAAIHPPLVWISAYVFSETLFMPLAFGCVLLLGVAERRAGAAHAPRAGGTAAIAAGLVAGAGSLVRPGM